MRKLRRLRAEKGLTMDALEARTGVSKRTISEIERGMRAPQILTLAKLAGALGVDVDELAEEEAPKATAPKPSGPDDKRALGEFLLSVIERGTAGAPPVEELSDEELAAYQRAREQVDATGQPGVSATFVPEISPEVAEAARLLMEEYQRAREASEAGRK